MGHQIHCRYQKVNSVEFSLNFEHAAGDMTALESDFIFNLVSDALGIYIGSRVRTLQDKIDVFRMDPREKELIWPSCLDVRKSVTNGRFDIWIGFDEKSVAQNVSSR